jgi:hypothetical protein
MRAVIIGCGSATIGLKAAMIATQCQVVTVDNNTFIDRYATVIGNRYEEILSVINEDYGEQTPPSGRSEKAHNIILSMNKKGRKW